MTKEQLKAEIRRKIYENTGGEITGQVLQDVLLNIADGTTDGGSGSGQDGVGISAITVSDIGSQVLASPSLMRAGGDMVLGASSSSGKKITIILTDGRRTSFNIYDGADGADGRDGKDGVDGANGEDGAAGPQGPAGRDGDTIGQEEIEEMYRRFDEYKTELSGRVESIKEDLESGVAQDVMDALNDLGLTQQELENLKTRLTDAANKAQSALDLARSLSGITGSGITAEQLEEILSKNREVEAWMNEFSGKVGTLMSDYDELNQQVGAIGIGLDTANGKIGVLTNNINILSGTVGSVKSDWDASKGRLTDLATWYDSSASTYAELVRQMDGLNARIDDRISLMTPESIVGMDQYIDGKLAEFGRTIEVSGVDLTHIEERLNGLSGIVSTAITRYDGLSGSVTSIENSMNAMEGRLTTAMTIAQSAMTEATSMRETWNQESGMLRTVTDLVIKKDVNGDPIYWYVNPELEDPSDKSQWIRVYYQGEDPSTGLPYYTTQKNGGGTRYDSNVLPDYMSTMLSYIQQNSDSIEFTVTSGDVISALRLQVTEDGSKIILNSDMVEINSDVFAKSLQASGANIGGVWIGDGMISAQTGSNRWALTSDGKLTATNADIKGNITASTLTLGSQGIDAYIASKIPEGMDNGDVNALISSAANVNNWVVEEDLGDFVKMGVRIGNSVSSVTISEQGLLTAKNAIISGTVFANSGIFNGTLMSTSGSIGGVKLSTIGLSIGSAFSLTTTSGLISHNATIYGSIRQPFGHLTQTGVNAAALRKYDNVYFDDNTESGVIVIDLSEEQETFGLSWDTSQIGRRITIVNNRGGKRITDYGYSKLTAPSGYYFFEDGIGTANLMFSNEIIELLGYGESDNNIFYGWIVMNRRNMMTKKRYGHELRLLATGTIKSGQSITNLTTFDGTAYMSYTQAMQQSTGSTSYYRNPNFSKISCTSNYIASNHYDYEVRLPNKWFYGASNIEKNMRVQLFSRTPGVYPAYISGNTSGFSYTTTNMLNYVAGDVDFYIYNMGDWDCLATDATLELTSDYYTWQVWDYDSSKSKNFNITVNPSTASITTGVTYGSQSPFTYSWNSSSKRLTATYNGNGGHQSVADTITITATAGSETASITIRCYYDVWVDPCNSDT